MPTQRQIDIAKAIRLRRQRQEEMNSYFYDQNEVSSLDQRVATAMNPKQFTPKMDTTPIYLQPMSMDIDSSATADPLTLESVPHRPGPVTSMISDIRGNPEEQGTLENLGRGAAATAATLHPLIGGLAFMEAGAEAKNPAKPIGDMLGSIADTYKRQVTGEGGGMTRGEAWSKTPVEETLNLAAPVLALLPFAKSFLGKRGASIKVAPETLAKDIADMGFDVEAVDKPAVRSSLEKKLIEKYGKGIDEKGQPIADEVGIASEKDIAKEVGRKPVKKGKGTTAVQQALTQEKPVEETYVPPEKQPESGRAQRRKQNMMQEAVDMMGAKGVKTDDILKAKFEGGDISLGALGSPDVYQALGESIAKGANWMLDNFHESQLKGMARLTTGVAERLKSPAAQSLVGEIDKNMGLQMRLVGQASEALIESHFQKMTKAEANNLSEIMRGAKVAPVSDKVAAVVPVTKALFEKMHEVATGAGMEIGHIKDYFPNMLKHDVAVKLRDDIRTFVAEAEKIVKDRRDAGDLKGASSDQALLEVFKGMELLQDGLNPETVSIIQSGIKNGRSFPYTMLDLRNYLNDDPVMPFGNLEKHRTLKFPSQFYETDARIIMGKYINGWARRVAETAQWGKDNRRVTEMLMDIQKNAPQEYGTASKMFDTYIGKFAPEQYLTGGTRKAVGNVMGGTVATLGSGFATFLNLFQIGISAATKGGWINTAKAVGKIGKGIYESKIAGDYSAYLRSLRETGAPYTANALEMLGGVLDGDTIGEMAASKSLKFSGFTGVNKFNQYVAAGVGKELLADLTRLANDPKSIRRKWAQKTLKEDFKIDYDKPLSTNQQLEAIGRWANDSQLQRNILRDPLWMNQPNTKFLATFKKFPFRQAQYAVKDIIVKEIKRGNALPTARLLAAGVLGGEAAIFGMNWVKEILSGDPNYRKEGFGDWERYANDLAAVGTLGAFTEAFKVNSTLPEDQIVEAAEKAFKLFSPVFLEKIYGTTVGSPGSQDTGGAVGTIQETAKHGVGAGMQKFLEEVSSQLGAIPANLGKRLKSDETELRGNKKKRSDETEAIAYLLLKDKSKEANRRLELWMQNYPDLSIEPDALESAMERLSMREYE